MQLKTWHRNGLVGAMAIALSLATWFEGESHVAYRDSGGTLTICDGHTKGVFPGMTATHAQCVAWLTKEMQGYLDAVDRLTVVRQPDIRRAGLADFAYNEGIQALADSRALQDINAGNIKKGCAELQNYERIGNHHHVHGLVLRRDAEEYTCLDQENGDIP